MRRRRRRNKDRMGLGRLVTILVVMGRLITHKIIKRVREPLRAFKVYHS